MASGMMDNRSMLDEGYKSPSLHETVRRDNEDVSSQFGRAADKLVENLDVMGNLLDSLANRLDNSVLAPPMSEKRLMPGEAAAPEHSRITNWAWNQSDRVNLYNDRLRELLDRLDV